MISSVCRASSSTSVPSCGTSSPSERGERRPSGPGAAEKTSLSSRVISPTSDSPPLVRLRAAYGATAIAEHIRAEIRSETGLTASAGIAPNKFIAKIASDWKKPDGLFVVRPEHVLDFLAPLKVGRIPGVGKVMEAKLGELGIATIMDLRQYPLPALEARFGRYGQRLHELSLGIDEHGVHSERPTQQISAEDTFADDVPLAATGPTIEVLAGKVWRGAVLEAERVGRTVVLKLKTREFRILTRSLTPPEPPADLAALTRIALALRDRVDLPARTRYRLVGVGLGNFISRDAIPAQAELFSAA